MKKAIITLLCLALLAGGGKFGYDRYKKSQNDKRIVDVVPVSMLSDEYGWYSYQDNPTFDGRVVSSNTQTVGLGAEDQIKEVKVKVGDYVKKGDVLVELDTTLLKLQSEQKKAEIGVIEQNIKKAEKELTRLKGLLPSEMKPYTPDPVYPDEPDFPEDSEDSSSEDDSSLPDKPELKLIDRLGTFQQVSEVDEDGTFRFNMAFEAEVAAPFMSQIKNTKRKAVLNVYSEEGNLLYMWVLDGAADEKLSVYTWHVNDGVTVMDGMVSYDGSGEGKCGSFFVYTGPQDSGDSFPDDFDDSLPDISDDYEPDDIDDGGYDFGNDQANDSTPANENYMYSRADLDGKIRTQENNIKDLQLDLRTKKLEYEESLKKLSDGKIVAKIDGIVAKVGSETLSGNSEDNEDAEFEDGDDGENLSEEIDADLDIDASLLDSSYIIVRGDEATCVEIQVGELNLGQFAKGTQLMGMNYQTGEMFTINVTGVKDEPVSYYSFNWNDNPNSSTFIVTGTVEDENSLTIDSWIQVSAMGEMPTDEDQSSGSIYLPMWYLHREGAGYYVMKADENGLLKKQYVKSGKELYGECVEIKGGISLKDKICFPYGKDVREGVKTRDSEEPVNIWD